MSDIHLVFDDMKKSLDAIDTDRNNVLNHPDFKRLLVIVGELQARVKELEKKLQAEERCDYAEDIATQYRRLASFFMNAKLEHPQYMKRMKEFGELTYGKEE